MGAVKKQPPFLCGGAIRNGGSAEPFFPLFRTDIDSVFQTLPAFSARETSSLTALAKNMPYSAYFLTRRAPKAAEAILTVFPINAKTAGLSPKTAKRIVQHILLRCRDAVCSHIYYFTLGFRFAPYDRQADEVMLCSAWQRNYGFVR